MIFNPTSVSQNIIFNSSSCKGNGKEVVKKNLKKIETLRNYTIEHKSNNPILVDSLCFYCFLTKISICDNTCDVFGYIQYDI